MDFKKKITPEQLGGQLLIQNFERKQEEVEDLYKRLINSHVIKDYLFFELLILHTYAIFLTIESLPEKKSQKVYLGYMEYFHKILKDKGVPEELITKMAKLLMQRSDEYDLILHSEKENKTNIISEKMLSHVCKNESLDPLLISIVSTTFASIFDYSRNLMEQCEIA